MTQKTGQAACQCACGKNQFMVAGAPLLRAVCHCRICQEFNASTHADILMYRRSQVDFPDDSQVAYRVYKQPPLVRRGKCRACDKPVIEYLRMPFFPELAIVPTENHPQPESLPLPLFHMFYHRRVADAQDDLPKYSGFIGSQLGFMRHLVPALRRT